jgi:hypothetical protein
VHGHEFHFSHTVLVYAKLWYVCAQRETGLISISGVVIDTVNSYCCANYMFHLLLPVATRAVSGFAVVVCYVQCVW